MRAPWIVLLVTCLERCVNGETSLPNTGDQDQGGTFDIISPSRTQQKIPIVDSCPNTFQISQLGAMNNYQGPAPAAPHTLVVLAREQIVDGGGIAYERIYSKTIPLGNLGAPFTVSPPWRAGTQFIACLWSSNKVSGGCQDLYTVTNTTNSLEAFQDVTSQCMVPDIVESWVPNNKLSVDVEDEHGLLADNGWPATCSDLRFTPLNGTAPYTLLIAPAFHTPVNITSNSSIPDNAMNYTVRLTHGQAFFAAVYDATGASFAIGPLHAGQSNDVDCLKTLTGANVSDKPKNSLSPDTGLIAGSAVGGLVAGVLLTALSTWLIMKKKKNRNKHHGIGADFSPLRTGGDDMDLYPAVSPYRSPTHDKASPVPSGPVSLYEFSGNSLDHTRTRSREGIDPNDTYRRSMGLSEFGGGSLHNPFSDEPRSTSSRDLSSRARWRKSEQMGSENESHEEHGAGPSRNVYVVHSDAGPGNLTIQLPAGPSNVVELPPLYINGEEVPRDQPYTQLSPPLPQHSPPMPSTHSYSPELLARAQAQLAEKRRNISG